MFDGFTTFTKPDPNEDILTMTKLKLAKAFLEKIKPASFVVLDDSVIEEITFIPGMLIGPKYFIESTEKGTTAHLQASYRQDTYYIPASKAVELEAMNPELVRLMEWHCKRPDEDTRERTP